MKRWLFWIVLGILLICLVFPKKLYCNDGGSRVYKAPLYELTFYHRIDETQPDGYYTGIGFKILCFNEMFFS